MGQYYIAHVKHDGDDKIRSYRGEFLKLMETAWMENEFPQTVAFMIFDSPASVAWVGDYSDAAEDDCWQGHYSAEEYNQLYGVLHDSVIEPENDPVAILDDFKYNYLINNSKKIYLDMKKYIKKSTNKGWTIHPIPVLTATSNGKGGGDYQGKNMELVGSWAFDSISTSNDKPEDFEEVDGHFFRETWG